LEEGRSYTDPEVRKGYYLEVQKNLAENVPWVWLYVGYEYRVMVPSLKGFVPTPNGSLWSLRQVYFE
jgi:peptide/nickel transport system substrate-binding protein